MYELSDEEKRRIREEEEAAAERDRYRAFVRQQMQPESLPETAKRAPTVEYFIPWGRVLAFSVVVLIGIILIIQYSTMTDSTEAARRTPDMGSSSAARSPIARVRREPHLDPVVNEQTVVKAGSYGWYTFKVVEGMESAKLIGKFIAQGGSGNDVEVVVATPADFQNWVNGHVASLIWRTPGKLTAGEFEVRLRPGTYTLGFSNKFSAFTDKRVTIEAKLFYETVTTVVE